VEKNFREGVSWAILEGLVGGAGKSEKFKISLMNIYLLRVCIKYASSIGYKINFVEYGILV